MSSIAMALASLQNSHQPAVRPLQKYSFNKELESIIETQLRHVECSHGSNDVLNGARLH